MPSSRLMLGLSLATAALMLGGCSGGPGAGLVTGVVLFNGKPAAGKRVTLVGGDGTRAVTDANGRYTFTGVPAKRMLVLFKSASDTLNPIDGKPVGAPNEVSEWRSAAFDGADGGGKDLAPFDVAYNGLLYPDESMSLIVNSKQLVPFHWSTHPQGQQYRVKLTNEAAAFSWASEWTKDPTTVFGKDVPTGRFSWQVEIDGGDAGIGLSPPRMVDF